MHSGRGAKGSIGDRIISMLYRNRYKKYKLTKEQYLPDKKNKQIKYIKNLKEYQATNETIFLEREDKNILDEIKVTKVSLVVPKSVIKNVDNKLTVDNKLGIENTSSKHVIDECLIFEDKKNLPQEIVDLDIEEKKINNEIKILDEVSNIVLETKERIEIINVKIKQIDEELKNVNDPKKVLEYQEAYNELVKEYNKLKEKYKALKESYNLNGYDVLQNYIIEKSISDYKENASLEEITMLTLVCRENSKKIDECFEPKKIDETGIKIEEKNNKIVKDKIAINETEVTLSKYNILENYLLNEEKKQQEIIANINKNMYKVYDIVNEKKLVYTGANNMLESFMRVTVGILTLPLTNISHNKLGMNLIKKGTRKLNEFSYRNIPVKRYVDLENQINKSKNSLDELDDIIIDAYDELLLLEYNFKKDYEKYQGIFSEYDSFLEKIKNIKKVLSNKRMEIDLYQKDLQRQMSRNNRKVKVKVND